LRVVGGFVIEIDFNGLTALVTGASSGIGAETAIRFGVNGAYTLIHYRENLEGATEVLERIRRGGGDGDLIPADLSIPNLFRKSRLVLSQAIVAPFWRLSNCVMPLVE